MSDGRKWVPESYVDEISPPGRSSPSAWIVSVPGDAYALAPCDEHEPGEPQILRDGAVVQFAWTESFGEAMFLVGEDRKWTVDREPPEGVTHVCYVGDPDSMGYGKGRAALENFAVNWIENEPDPGQEMMIKYYAWSEAPVHFVFNGGAFTPAAIV